MTSRLRLPATMAPATAPATVMSAVAPPAESEIGGDQFLRRSPRSFRRPGKITATRAPKAHFVFARTKAMTVGSALSIDFMDISAYADYFDFVSSI